MKTVRKAKSNDLDFLVWIDRKDEGVSSNYMDKWSQEEFLEHRKKMKSFINDDDKLAFVLIDESTNEKIGGVCCRFRDLANKSFPCSSVFLEIDGKHFQGDGRFCEVYQLWIHPCFRRKGLGTLLKSKLEEESISRGILNIYTHTETKNYHVIELNRKLGYFEVRRGPIWDEIERVSLVKHLKPR